MRDIALTLNKPAFLDKVKAVAPGESETDKLGFALNLRRDLFKIEPTAMLVNMIKDTKVPLLNDATGTNIAAVLCKQPDFNIRSTSVYELFKSEEAFNDIAINDDNRITSYNVCYTKLLRLEKFFGSLEKAFAFVIPKRNWAYIIYSLRK